VRPAGPPVRRTVGSRGVALQAHSALRYTEWRAVIADYVAARRGLDPDDLRPRTVAHVSLALALSAYDQWLKLPDASSGALLDQAMAALVAHLKD
jgi:hypothetical protein